MRRDGDPEVRAYHSLCSDPLDDPIPIDPEADDFGVRVETRYVDERLGDLLFLHLVGHRVAGAVVMGHDRDLSGPMNLQRDVEVGEEGGSLVCLGHQMLDGPGGGDGVDLAHAESGVEIVGDLAQRPAVHALEDRSVTLDSPTLGGRSGTSRMESVPPGYEYSTMEILIAIGAVLSGLVTLAVGMYALAAIFFDDLV